MERGQIILEASAAKSICILQSRYDSTKREEYKNMKNVFCTCIVLHLTTSISCDVTFLKNVMYNFIELKSKTLTITKDSEKAV